MSASTLPHFVVPPPGPNARRILERDAAVCSASYARPYPFVMERGEGACVWDPDGNRYLDFAAGIAVCSTGHSHPDVVAALGAQASRFLHMSGANFCNEPMVRTAEMIAELDPVGGGPGGTR
ncbi:MAG TPA: aminotransferase class III-fold pyridoxal phosphate-dependent enzyme, partial [Candidatus Polarisedimenticolia bacterium]|nr:aminotransferase class III-fold pyridoxal phosphate-dependent enzyme [Candidatus Polarisedimenticolia bacterium]